MKNRSLLVIVVVIVLAVLIVVPYGYYKTEFSKKPAIQERFQDGDLRYLYNFYVSNTPEIAERPWYGHVDAEITMMGFIDIDEDSSRYFMDEIFPRLEQDYIFQDKMRFIHKYSITQDDIDEKNANYRYAASLECVREMDPAKYYDVYFMLFDLQGPEDIPQVITKNELDLEQYQTCMAKGNFPSLIADLTEIEGFAIVGINPRFYIGIAGTDNTAIDGVPSYKRFKDTIRQAQLVIGD